MRAGWKLTKCLVVADQKGLSQAGVKIQVHDCFCFSTSGFPMHCLHGLKRKRRTTMPQMVVPGYWGKKDKYVADVLTFLKWSQQWVEEGKESS